MRTMLALVALCAPLIATAQVISSANLGCTVVASGGMACNGIGDPETKKGEKKAPKLFLTHFTLEPGAALDQPSTASDCLIIGINGGDLLNEEMPLLYVSLAKDAITLMPREQPFRLRNKGSGSVEFRMIEIRR